MRLLVVGSGGREHAMAWRLARDPDVRDVVCAPGNPGTAQVARRVAVAPTALHDLAQLAESQADLTIVGPELPLAHGLVDHFVAAGLPVLGPTRAAARLETSKIFAKHFMARHRVPTADFRVCATASEAARAIDELGVPVVVKADGLAAGKGVVVAGDRPTAEAAVRAALVDGQFGDAGAALVLEECLVGEEVSFFVLCDGTSGLSLGSAQDHKRVFDLDLGPNTGGMGAFAPSPRMTPALEHRVMTQIVEPVLAGMAAEGAPFRGFLYVGLMLTAAGPKVVEFNVRFGDPEAQVVWPGLEGPLAARLAEAATGRLSAGGPPLTFSTPHVGVVLASGGYPGPFERGKPISGLDAASALEDVLVFHAGTTVHDDQLVTDGGRVLTVVGRGTDFTAAIARAYEAAACIRFDGMHLRRDIGRRAVAASR